MTPDTALDPIDGPKPIQPPSTAGMTTKVVKGSMWTLVGSVLPLAVSFISTPFIIRFLGAESYGVLLLVGLIPMYFSFADFGMGVASTKFASEAFGEGDGVKEGEFVWTAAAAALVASVAIALPIFFFSGYIVTSLNVPTRLFEEGSLALRITSAAFVLGVLASVINSPMLARIRMDFNMLTSAVPRVLLALLTPVVLYFGGGIVGAAWWSLIVSIGTVVAVFYFSASLLPNLWHPAFNSQRLQALLKFGSSWFIATMAATLLVHLEKFLLTKIVSVEALAYYSVAFTFASMAAMFSTSMIQSLVPAFAQLQRPEKRSQLDRLFSRAIRLSIVCLLPVVTVMFTIAKPFFTVWAGPDFGRESVGPFYILLVGLFCGVVAYIPHSAIIASGRADIFAKLYWSELALYSVVAAFLVGYFDIFGAAIAWTLRAIIDACVIVYLAKRITGLSVLSTGTLGNLLLGCLILWPPAVATVLFPDYSIWMIVLSLTSLTGYIYFTWSKVLEHEERVWASNRLVNLLK